MSSTFYVRIGGMRSKGVNNFDRELLKQGVQKEDIDDFNNWLKHRPLADKLADFFVYILFLLLDIQDFIQIPFRGLKWWRKINEPLCNDKNFEHLFNKVSDDIENNNLDKAEKDLDISSHYVKNWIKV